MVDDSVKETVERIERNGKEQFNDLSIKIQKNRYANEKQLLSLLWTLHLVPDKRRKLRRVLSSRESTNPAITKVVGKLQLGPAGEGVLPYIGYTGMYHWKGYGFLTI